MRLAGLACIRFETGGLARIPAEIVVAVHPMRVRPPGQPSAWHLDLLLVERWSGPASTSFPWLKPEPVWSSFQRSERKEKAQVDRSPVTNATDAAESGGAANATYQGSFITKLIADARWREPVTERNSWPQDSAVPERDGEADSAAAPPPLLASWWPHVHRLGSCARAASRFPCSVR